MLEYEMSGMFHPALILRESHDRNGIVAIGECMLELSGKGGQDWRMGFAGDTLNTLWALRALTGPERAANYVSAFGDDPFSRDQIAFFGRNGIGIGDSPIIPGARPGLYAITLTGAERSFTYWRSDSAAKQLASSPTHWRKAWKTRRLSIFPESLWQFSSPRLEKSCSTPYAPPARQAASSRSTPTTALACGKHRKRRAPRSTRRWP